jgi:hypothetical protein
MLNQGQFPRQIATVLLACGLITSLLPGFLAAQDLFTRESLAKDREWVCEAAREWQWKDGVLRLRTQPGGVWGPTEPARNVLVSKSAIEGKGSMEALIGLEDPIRKWEQVGLLDPNRLVRLVKQINDGHPEVPLSSPNCRLRRQFGEERG